MSSYDIISFTRISENTFCIHYSHASICNTLTLRRCIYSSINSYYWNVLRGDDDYRTLSRWYSKDNMELLNIIEPAYDTLILQETITKCSLNLLIMQYFTTYIHCDVYMYIKSILCALINKAP